MIDPRGLPPFFAPRLQRAATTAAGVGAFGLLLGFAFDPRQTLFSYLVAFSFFITISVGALGWLLAFQATGARWVVVARRLLEIGAASIPLFVLLFVPIAVGLQILYPWVSPVATDAETLALLAHKRPWLNVPFFLVRALAYLAIWSTLGLLLLRWSRRQDQTGELGLTVLQRRVGAVGLPLYGLSVAFASFDWLMSLQPTWYSTIFGVYWWAGGFLAAMAAWILAAAAAESRGSLPPGLLGEPHYHSMGKLLFAFVCFWAYIGFSQFMLIWIANLPEETQYFVLRRANGYHPIFFALIFLHFVIPFFLLLPRAVKRSRAALSAMAAWVLAAHWLDSYWMVMPHRGPGAFFHWQDLAALLGVGGAAVLFAVLRLRDAPPVPIGDPYLTESVAYDR